MGQAWNGTVRDLYWRLGVFKKRSGGKRRNIVMIP
jgi:hypothetical protein